MSQPDFESAYQILCRVLQTDGKLLTARRYNAYRVWNSVVGTRIARRARIAYVQGSLVTVRVASPIWAQELSLMKQEILEKLNKALPGACFEDIRFVVGARIDRQEKDRRRTDAGPVGDNGLRPPARVLAAELPGSPVSEVARSDLSDQLSNGIPDERVRNAFLRWHRSLTARTQALIARGFSRCPGCGAVTEDARRCPYCTTKQERQAYLRAWTLLSSGSDVTWDEVCRHAGSIHPGVLLAARSDVEHLLLRRISSLLPYRKDRSKRKTLVENLRKLAALRAGRSVSDAERDLMGKLLGERYFKLLEEMSVS